MDYALLTLINRASANWLYDAILPVLTDGTLNGLIMASVGLLLLAGPLARRDWPGLQRAARVVVVAGLALALGDLLGGQVLKPLFDRPRPPFVLTPDHLRQLHEIGKSGSMPSNHAINTSAVMGAIALGYPRWAGWAMGYAALISYSRVYVGVHWPSDIVVGMVIGLVMAWALWQLSGRLLAGLATRRSARAVSA